MGALDALLYLILSQPAPEVPDDGYRLLDGHFVGRVGCTSDVQKGDRSIESQPAGNLTLRACKARCDAVDACRGVSFRRGSMHRDLRPPSTCLLKHRCTGRAATTSVCEPDGIAIESGSKCIARRSNDFNYMRVVPLQHESASSPTNDVDYNEPTASSVAMRPPATDSVSWASAVARLPLAPARVALLYLNLGSAWPPWTHFVLLAADANRDVDFYFLGAQLDLSPCAQNCARLPFDLASLRARVRRHLLNVSAVDQFGSKGNAARKLCDLVPMWPALFPELSARHKFIGMTEQDMLPGNLSSELVRLRDEDDMMLPFDRFPQPLTDANFMVYRTTSKMLQAFRRVPNWEQVITTNRHFRFDEWVVEPPSVMVAFQEMLMAGELRVVPLQRFLVQDVVVIRKRRYPRIDDHGARVVFKWRQGRLLVERDGPCICPRDVVPVHGIANCIECIHNPGAVLRTQTSRRLEVFGFHFSAWKQRWRTPDGGTLPHSIPRCTGDFDLTPSGFTCVDLSAVRTVNASADSSQPQPNPLHQQQRTRRRARGPQIRAPTQHAAQTARRARTEASAKHVRGAGPLRL
jgi:hypothetical protein